MLHIQETGVEMELEENMPLLEWLANNYKKFGAGLEIITDRSQVRQLVQQAMIFWREFFVCHVASHVTSGGKPICARIWWDWWNAPLHC